MKRHTLAGLMALPALLVLTACHGQSESQTQSLTADKGKVHITKSVDINGAKSKSDLTLTAFAMRARLGNTPTSAGYVTIKNGGDADDRLISVTCACASKISLHSMSNSGGMMAMADAPQGFVIKAGQSLVLAPGGNHIMFEGVNTGLNDGDTQPIVLHFEKAGDVTLDMPVSSQPLAAPVGDESMSGMKM